MTTHFPEPLGAAGPVHSRWEGGMDGNLNARTRRVVGDLIGGVSLSLGGKPVKPLDATQGRFLAVLAANVGELSQEKGADLAQKMADLFEVNQPPAAPTPPTNSITASPRPAWRLLRARACSFRGLAPAGCVWEHEFAGRSHLFYGPNGCGKSSMLGAVTWCLTGRIYRDDRAPALPEDVTVFTAAKRPTLAGLRSDGLALTNEAGASTPLDADYWVEVQLGAAGGSILWLRRSRVDGLSQSADGQVWTTISSLEEVGISELDSELYLLMPARVSHIRFGKDSDLVHLFSQVVGLDDLEAIAELAGKVHAALSREATRIEQADLSPLQAKIGSLVARIEAASSPLVRAFPSFISATSAVRTLGDVKKFGEALKSKIHEFAAQLARDLGIGLAEGPDAASGASGQDLDNLPGQVQLATEELAKDLHLLFENSLGLKVPGPEVVEDLARRLEQFETVAREKTKERLAWGLRAAADARMALLLKAAAHFPDGSSECPVCAQDLGNVPAVTAVLEDLRDVADRLHLHQAIDDLERSLLAEIDGILAPQTRTVAERCLADRIHADWKRLKELRFPDLLQGVAERFDAKVEAVAEGTRLDPMPLIAPLSEGYEETFPDAYTRLDTALAATRRYIRFARSLHASTMDISASLTNCLKAEQASPGGESLLLVLRRGRTINEQLDTLEIIRDHTRELYQDERRRGEIARKVTRYRAVAAAAEPTKALGQAVRQEVIDVMKSVEPVMRGYYQKLYGDDRLMFDTLTTGHAANAKVKNELNVYLRAGEERVPIGPYANGGRLRALTLSFVFALLEKSGGSIGLLILDDPALSLDDAHKSRLLDHLVRPCLAEHQVVLATHYETFYKLAEPIFSDAERLQLAPRRTSCDALAFEPADLLQRLEEALRTRSCSWREAGINLRRWAERVLHTLSGYCPQPFVRFNDIAGSVAAYAAITDPGVATDRRDKIVAALISAQFQRVMHRFAHDEDPTESEARDALECLKKCRKEADAEIERLKQQLHHDLLGRAIEGRPAVIPLRPTAVIPNTRLWIEGAAAAARNGVGITWSEREVGDLAGHGLVLVKVDTLAPIASVGQYLLLDPEDAVPGNKDLAIVQTEDGAKYVRRVWLEAAEMNLQAANPNVPYTPIRVRRGQCYARRVIGVLFDGVRGARTGGDGEEWVCPGNVPPGLLRGVMGVRVNGTSLEPLARHGQVVLARRREVTDPVPQGALACVDIRDVGAVIKRCYQDDSEWVLCPVNPVDVAAPMRVLSADILRVYLVVGVLFKMESTVPEPEDLAESVLING